MVLVGLILRLIVVGFCYQDRLDPTRDYFHFAGETGRIARSIAQGKGFSNPLFGDTGPTAWMTPLYPYLLSFTFLLFGVYTKASAIAMLSLNSLFSAMTCLPVFFMARRTFGELTAIRAGWAWAFFPYAIYFPGNFIWSTVLTTFLLALAFAVGLRLGHSSRLKDWILFGVVSAIAVLSDAIAMSVLPLVGLWMWYRRSRRASNWLLPGATAALAFLVVVSPWFVRNYVVFHKFIPFRDNFGLELCVGNDGTTWYWAAGPHPTHQDEEWQEYRQIGELAYMKHKQEQAMRFISQHKGRYAELFLRRAVYMWTNYWSFDPRYLAAEPFDPPAVFLTTTLTLLALWGLWLGWRDLGTAVVPYAMALFFFPVVYYTTHLEDYYRRPADPFFVVLATHALSRFLEKRKNRAAQGASLPQVRPAVPH